MLGLCGVRGILADGSRPRRLSVLVSGLAVVTGLIAGAAGAAPGAAAKPQLRFAPVLGNELPNNGSKAEVVVVCAGAQGAGCNGVVELLPRGVGTRRLVGNGPVSSRSIRKASVGNEHAIVLRLDASAHKALARGEVLQLTIELRQAGRTAAARNVVAAKERAVVGHRQPDSVVRHIVVRNLGGRSAAPAAATTTVEYNWSWNIPVRTFLVLPDFRCPAAEPYVAGATKTRTYVPRRAPVGSGSRVWARVGMLTAVAKAGTGYGAFTTPHLTDHNGVRMMTGWPKGSWTGNNAWAPLLFEDGKFELKVTCTSSDALDNVAWVGENVDKNSETVTFPTSAVFPWAVARADQR